jgi:hypothetical protein
MSDKFDRFKRALFDLCDHHKVTIKVDAYDSLCVHDADVPWRINVVDKTVPEGPVLFVGGPLHGSSRDNIRTTYVEHDRCRYQVSVEHINGDEFRIARPIPDRE